MASRAGKWNDNDMRVAARLVGEKAAVAARDAEWREAIKAASLCCAYCDRMAHDKGPPPPCSRCAPLRSLLAGGARGR